MKCERILVPVDFSADSERALDYAVQFAVPFDASLTLMHVTYIPDPPGFNLDAVIRRAETDRRQDLLAYQKRTSDAGLLSDTHMDRGLPALKIVEAAQHGEVDLIVMGTHGRTGLKHLLLGSVAERVVQLASCPVIVVPNQA